MAACHQLEMPRRGRKHLFGGNHPQNPEPTGKGQKHSQDLDWKAGIRHTSRQDMTASDTGTCSFLGLRAGVKPSWISKSQLQE